MSVRAIFEVSIDGDSIPAYSLKAICVDIPAAVRWIMAHPAHVITNRPPAHPLMNAQNGWSVYCPRAEVDLLDSQSKAGDFGYVIEEIEVVV